MFYIKGRQALTVEEMIFDFAEGIACEEKDIGCCIQANIKLFTGWCLGNYHYSISVLPLVSSVIFLVLQEIIIRVTLAKEGHASCSLGSVQVGKSIENVSGLSCP